MGIGVVDILDVDVFGGATKALAPNLNTTNQLNIQVKAIDIQAGYDGSLNVVIRC
jgi:hypothetical protein